MPSCTLISGSVCDLKVAEDGSSRLDFLEEPKKECAVLNKIEQVVMNTVSVSGN